jgi:hypothetical protein
LSFPELRKSEIITESGRSLHAREKITFHISQSNVKDMLERGAEK